MLLRGGQRMSVDCRGSSNRDSSIRKNCCSCRWGETTSLSCGHHRAYCSSNRWNMSTGSHSGMTSTVKKPKNSAPGLRGERLETNHLNPSTALLLCFYINLSQLPQVPMQGPALHTWYLSHTSFTRYKSGLFISQRPLFRQTFSYEMSGSRMC
jgi:hypothetical protein